MKKIYNKLIRDKIPEIIEKNNGKPKIRKLKKTDFFVELKNKITEEGDELQKATTKEDLINELADILELVESIAKEKISRPRS